MGGSDGYPGLQVWFMLLNGGGTIEGIGGMILGLIGLIGGAPVSKLSGELGPPSGAITGTGPLIYGVLYGFLPTQKSRQPPISNCNL